MVGFLETLAVLNGILAYYLLNCKLYTLNCLLFFRDDKTRYNSESTNTFDQVATRCCLELSRLYFLRFKVYFV